AAAMVNTWRDSWFQESGLRVLYVLPRAWTDRVLPLSVTPRPRELARVMVGRAEMIMPTLEWELMKQIVHYSETDESQRSRAVENTRNLGRFAESAARRLTSKIANREFNRLSWELLEAASKRETQPKSLAKK